MPRLLLALVAGLVFAPAARAAVIVVANFTPNPVTFTLAEPDRKPQTVTLDPDQVGRVVVAGPATVTYPDRAGKTTLLLDPFNAYVFTPDPKAGRRLGGVELPGNPPDRDTRPEENPPPAGPVKVPVTLLVDDADPRADRLWQDTLRKRLAEAAAVVEAHAGVRFEFAGFGTWRSDPTLKDLPGLLADFEGQVRVKPGGLAVGYTSRKVEDREKDPTRFGTTRPVPTTHVLLREWHPKAEPERVEVLIHHLGLALGATLSPDPGSVMRPALGNGLALAPRYRYRFDPLNALAMNVWADELRRGPVAGVADVTPVNRTRLARVYKALLKARPGDTLAQTYLNELERDQAKAPDPKAAKDAPRDQSARDTVARAVVRAVAERARANTRPRAVTGDDLTAAYVQAAADAATGADGLPADSPERAAGFLVGLAVALDDTDALRNDPLTASAVRGLETDAARADRVAALGNPTLRGRRDLCRRFVLGCGTGELLTPRRAEEVAVNRSLSLVGARHPAGISFPALAAELGGVAFARAVREDPEVWRRVQDGARLAEFLPNTDGLRDGLSVERFEEDYGDAGDDRFRAVLADIRERVKKAPGYTR